MPRVHRVPFRDLLREFVRVLRPLGFEKSAAETCARIFAQNSCDGVVSHGLNRFPGFVADVRTGVVDPRARPVRVRAAGLLEQWDGKLGAGPLNATAAMRRAVAQARRYGIGCVGLRNTNHWMRAGTYGLQAAGARCIGICWTNTTALIPPWGAAARKTGNNPLVVCIPHRGGPVLLDMAVSQFSMGRMDVFRRLGRKLPLAGGYDKAGRLTRDPDAILKSHRPLPIGYWKGSGLALALDLLAVLLSGGASTREITRRGKETGVSQVFLAIDLGCLGAAASRRRVNAIVRDFLDVAPLRKTAPVRYPGQGMLAIRKESLAKGVRVDPEIWQRVREM